MTSATDALVCSSSLYIPSALVRLAHPPSIFPLPSCDWLTLRVYSLCPCATGSSSEYIPSALVQLAHPP
eukprot:146868-Prorocentrum_minimum.AAC.1